MRKNNLFLFIAVNFFAGLLIFERGEASGMAFPFSLFTRKP
jgi:hypothetical protein